MKERQPKKIGFYPCCSKDILEPLQQLTPLVDEVVFCDINPRVVDYFDAIAASNDMSSFPAARFIIGDAREVIKALDRIDVLFYRKDSNGEGGSALYLFGKYIFPNVIEKFPEEGALIISDGSNARGKWWSKMKSDKGLELFGRKFKRSEVQPFGHLQGNGFVYQIEVLPKNA